MPTERQQPKQPFSQANDGVRYAIADDDIVVQLQSLRVVAIDGSPAFEASEWDKEQYKAIIEGVDDRGSLCAVMPCETWNEARQLLVGVTNDECQECRKPLRGGRDALVVLTAGGNLEWSFHRGCCDDARDHEEWSGAPVIRAQAQG